LEFFLAFQLKTAKNSNRKKKNKPINESAFMEITQKPILLSGRSNNDVACFGSK